MESSNRNKVIGIGIAVFVILAIVALLYMSMFESVSKTNKLPYSYVPKCATSNNCTLSACPADSYFNSTLGYCYWNYINASQSCPPGAVYQNGTNCRAEGDTCVAGYTYDKQNGLCEPLPEFCNDGYTLYAKNSLSNLPECALSNACSNGYTLTFNQSMQNFLCIGVR